MSSKNRYYVAFFLYLVKKDLKIQFLEIEFALFH